MIRYYMLRLVIGIAPVALMAAAAHLRRHDATVTDNKGSAAPGVAVLPGEHEQPSESKPESAPGSTLTSTPARPRPADPEPTSETRVNRVGTAVMLILLCIVSSLAYVVWPDTDGPTSVGPTIGGFAFSADTPGVDAAVRILINPDAQYAPHGASGVMVVTVSLDVPAGKTVRWALDLAMVSTTIKLDPIAPGPEQPLQQQSGRLIAAPTTYTPPQPINQVRDYVLVGQTQGPSSGYTQLTANNFQLGDNTSASITTLAWTGPLPAVFGGAYVDAVMPSLVANVAGSTPTFDFGWTPAPLDKFHAEEELALSGDYEINSGAQTSQGLGGWHWSSDGNQGIINASGFGTSLIKQSVIQRDTFLAGVLTAVAVSALLGVVPFLLPLVIKRPRQARSTADRTVGTVKAECGGCGPYGDPNNDY